MPQFLVVFERTQARDDGSFGCDRRGGVFAFADVDTDDVVAMIDDDDVGFGPVFSGHDLPR